MNPDDDRVRQLAAALVADPGDRDALGALLRLGRRRNLGPSLAMQFDEALQAILDHLDGALLARFEGRVRRRNVDLRTRWDDDGEALWTLRVYMVYEDHPLLWSAASTVALADLERPETRERIAAEMIEALVQSFRLRGL